MQDKYKKPIDSSKALLDFSVPADYERVNEFTEIMEKRYDFLRVTCIGESILGRKIHMITLGNEKADKSVLYVGAHHGAEWITTLILLRFVNELCEYFKSSRQPFGINLSSLLASRCLRIVPQLNPDGVDLQINGLSEDCILYDRLMKISGGDFSKWQANARGVDLNHNYDGGFLDYKEIEYKQGITAGPTRYSGEYPLSEPETCALASLIKYDPSIEMIITLHASGEEIYYSSGGMIPNGAERIADSFSRLSGYKKATPEGLSAYGGLTDWYIREFMKPSFTIECGKGDTPIHEKQYFAIYAGLREMLMWAPLLC